MMVGVAVAHSMLLEKNVPLIQAGIFGCLSGVSATVCSRPVTRSTVLTELDISESKERVWLPVWSSEGSEALL